MSTIYRLTFMFLLSITGCVTLQAQERGVASYYSNRLHGHKMSDGTRYHKDSLTCAHKKYPLGTKLKVTNLKNGKSVVVKVTDRCTSRRIDLSYAAAKQIDIIRAGIAPVTIEYYIERKGVPFRQDNGIEIPEFDYEVTKYKTSNAPEWLNAPGDSTAKPAMKPKTVKKTAAKTTRQRHS